jgi:CRP-like cAMP-binding protein
MERRTYRPGEVIIVEGADTSDAYLLEEGQVTVTRGGQHLRTLAPREIFGEMALITDQPRSATVTALTDVVVGVIDRNEFEGMWLRDPEALLSVVRVLCDRVRALNVLVDELAHQSPRSRETVAAHLPGEAAPAGDGGIKVTLEGATADAVASLDGAPRVIERFPFRIGRLTAPGDPLSDNDLGLHDRAPFHVSRSHCAITRVSGRAFLIDRGSRLGTVVGRAQVGPGASTQRAELPVGTTDVALGGARTPFRFRVTVAR